MCVCGGVLGVTWGSIQLINTSLHLSDANCRVQSFPLLTVPLLQSLPPQALYLRPAPPPSPQVAYKEWTPSPPTLPHAIQHPKPLPLKKFPLRLDVRATSTRLPLEACHCTQPPSSVLSVRIWELGGMLRFELATKSVQGVVSWVVGEDVEMPTYQGWGLQSLTSVGEKTKRRDVRC